MIETKEIRLRDFIESDIAKRIEWETTETEWQLWDAPWEYDGLSEDDKKNDLNNYIKRMHTWVDRYKDMPADKMRTQFQVETNDAAHNYIGWVSCYYIDDECNFADDETTDKKRYCTVGIDFPDQSGRGKGYSYLALSLFIQYLRKHGEQEIFIQTWSGNTRLVHIAEKMGFEEYNREIGFRKVRGNVYDGLTFKLNMNRFQRFCAEVLEEEM